MSFDCIGPGILEEGFEVVVVEVLGCGEGIELFLRCMGPAFVVLVGLGFEGVAVR